MRELVFADGHAGFDVRFGQIAKRVIKQRTHLPFSSPNWSLSMRSKIPLLIIIIALLMMGLFLSFETLRSVRQFANQFPRVVETELERSLGRQVVVKRFEVRITGRATITDLKISDGRTFQEGTLFTAERVVLRFSPLALLLSQSSVAASISEIRLVSPHVRLSRNPQGVWNIEDLLRRPPPPVAERFRGKVRIIRGQTTVTDYASHLPTLPAVNSVRMLSGDVDFGPGDRAIMNVMGMGEPKRLGRVRVVGPWGIGVPVTNLKLQVLQGNAEYWSRYFITTRSWHISKGVFDLSAVLTQPHKEGVVDKGNARLRHVRIVSPHLTVPIERVAANVNFVGTDSINIDAEGYLTNSPIQLRGKISEVNPSQLDLMISSERMDMNTLVAAIKPLPRIDGVRWGSLARIESRITGTSIRPKVHTFVSVANVIVYGTSVTALEAQGAYQEGTITVTRASAILAQGSVSASGVIDIAPLRISAKGTGKEIRLALLPTPATLRADGTADTSFSIEYFGGVLRASLHANVRRGRISELSFTDANIDVSVSASQPGQARVSLRQGTYRGIAIRVATADLSFRTGAVTIRRMAINALGGLIEGYGTIRKDGALNVSLAGTSIDLSELSKRLGYEQATGQVNFQGSLTRQVKDPYLAVTFAVRNGSFRSIGYNDISGRLEAARRQLVFQDLAMRLPRGKIATAGRIVIRPGAPASLLLNLSARNIDVQEALSVLGLKINASGLMTIDMDISGSLPNVQAAGTIVVRDAMLKGVSMDTVQAVLSYQGERILIAAVSASRGQMTVIGQGIVMRSGLLEMSIAGKNLQLGIFNSMLSPYVHLEGPFDFSGQIRGNYRRPTVKGRITSSTLRVNQQAFGNFAADVAWNDRTIALSNVRLEQDNADYRITSVTYTPSTSYLSLTGEASSVGIANVLSAATNSPIMNLPKGEKLRQFLATIPTPLTGTADVSLSLRGPVSRLSGTIFLTARDIHSGTSSLTTAGIELSVVASKFAAMDTALEGPEIRLRGSVLLSEERPVAVSLNVSDTKIPSLIALIENLPAISAYEAGRDVTRFVRGIENTYGLLNASIDLSNLEESPTGTISVSATSVSFRERQVGDVNANAHLRKGDIVLDGISIQPTQGQITLRGTIDRKGQMVLDGEVDSVQLSSLAPWFVNTDISGLVNASVSISGTLANPTVTGSISATDVRTAGTAFSSISVGQIVISNGTISFDQASVVAENGRFAISGSLPFMWTAPFVPREQPLHVHAEALEADLSVLESLSQVVESASGPLVASVDIRGSLDSPILDGTVTVRNGRVKLYNLDNEIADISISAKFADSTMTIESFDGTSSLGGSLSGTGEISFGEPGGAGVSLFLMIDNMRIRMSETPVVENLELTVGGPLTVTGKLDSLAIRGQLVLSDANIRVPAEPVEVATLAPSPPMGPQLDVALDIAHNVRIQRGTLSAEVVGPVAVTGTVERPIIAGTVQIVRGEIGYIGRTLELLPGGVASFLFSATAPPVVILEISARTQAFGVSPLTGGITRYTITLDISGPIGELAMRVRTSPPGLSDMEALSLLFSGTALDALLRGEPFEEVFQQQLGQILLGLAVPGLFQPFTVGELTFVLVPNFDTPVQLSGSVNLTSRLVLSHSRTVTGIVRSELSSLSYVLSPRFAATIQFENVQGARQTTYLIQYYTWF